MEIEIQIILGVFLTSILSGVMGMGGGLLLMALYTLILPVNLAMGLHGFTQFFSNGSRTLMHFKKIQFSIVFKYLIGSLLSLMLLSWIKFTPSKAIVFVCLGLFPFISILPKISDYLDITKPKRAFSSGFIVTTTQLIAGASGAILDIFYISSPLNRHAIIATKSITQTIGHTIKMVYYLLILNGIEDLLKLSPLLLTFIIVMTIFGNYIGKLILERLDEQTFRKYSKSLILMLGSILFLRGLQLV